MASRTYCFKFYLNSSHSLYDDNGHSHTWELEIHINNKDDKYIVFTELENLTNKYISQFEGKYLNEYPPFDVIPPIMENMGDVFAYQLNDILEKYDLSLKKLAISENPSRTYILDNDDKGYRNPLNPDIFESLADHKVTLVR